MTGNDKPADLTTHRFLAPDGTELAWHELGQGRPLVLIHGLFSNAFTNWIRYGHARRIAEAGFRVIMPDLRAHGESGAPHAAEAYPPDILAADGEALLAELGLGDGQYDLGGYSLGARTSLRMVVRGASPRRLIAAGMGIAGMLNTGARAAFFQNVLANFGSHQRGSPEFMAQAFLKSTGGDPQALLLLTDSFVDTQLEELAAIPVPTLVVAGADDADNGSASALADIIPDARFEEIPGNHMSAVTAPELGIAISNFLVAAS